MRGLTRSPAIVWQSLAVRLLLAAIPAWFTTAVLVFNTQGPEKVAVAIVLIVTLARPALGLVLVAAAAPLGAIGAAIFHLGSFRITEAIGLAFFTGWLLRAPEDRPGPRAHAAIGWAFAAVVAASVVAQAWALGRVRGELPAAVDLLYHAYYVFGDRIGFADALRLFEGVGLAAATVTLFRQRPALASALPAALAASGCAAAIAGLLLWYGIAPASILQRHALIGYRVSALVGDVNAAGSYFAMLLCLTLGMAGRGRGRARAAWTCVAALVGIGLWLTGSRSAFAAAGAAAVLGAAWIASGRWPRRRRVGALAMLLVAGVAVGVLRSPRVTSDPASRRGLFRQEFNATSARMIAARPLVGVGVGQYYRTSALFMSPDLAWSYGFENAHNYFLQMAAELGLVGVALFVGILGAGLLRAARALSVADGDLRLLGAAAGVAAFLATCLAGHPLLLYEIAFPFWIQFGLVVALAGSALLDRSPVVVAQQVDAPRPWPLAGVGAIAIGVVMLALVSAWRRDVEPPASAAIDGFYGWETGADGARYRWSGEYASVFVPSGVTRVYVPVRRPAPSALAPARVFASVDGAHRPPVFVGDDWAILDLELPDALPPDRVKRINLRVEPVWQPAVYVAGSSDLRSLGVQVGECRLFRER